MNSVDYPVFKREQLKIFDGMPSAVLINIMNDEGNFEYAYSNPFLAKSLGYEHEELQELLRKEVFALIYEADRKKTMIARDKVMSGEIVDSITRQNRKDGSSVWILAHLRKVVIDGRPGLFFLFSRIQELIGLQDELSQKNANLNDIVESIPIGVCVFRDDNGIRTTLAVNQNLVNVANIAGMQVDNKKREWTKAELGMVLNKDLFALCESEDIPMLQDMLQECEEKPLAKATFRLHGSSLGNVVYIYTTCSVKISDDGSKTYYMTFQNATTEENYRKELFEKQSQLFELSYFDSMTGVKNRNAYNDFVEFCRAYKIQNVGFAFCDLNGLKTVNDSMGHYYGDQMIKYFTSILKEFFENDQIFRISGDEFVVVCPDIDRIVFQNRMGEVIDRMQCENNLASIGFIWKKEVSDIPRRTQQAEQLMYVEKQRYYEISKNIKSKHRPQMLEALLQNFEDGRFVMYLQPKTSIDGSKIIGAEALARKIDINGDIVPPYEFVPQLEHERLIPKLDFYIMEQACSFLQEQHQLRNDDFSVSVNISRVTIAENEFIDTVKKIISKYDFVLSNLDFELTESNNTMDSIRLEEYIGALKKMDIQISIDDMGTDYSTLSLLTMDGINWVKLDRSLVTHLGDGKDRTLLKHIVSMCHDLGLKVIAEGVETDDIRLQLMDMGCDAYQGFLSSKPIPMQDFKELFL